MMREEHIRVEKSEYIDGKDVPYVFRDDCSGVIYDWAKLLKLTFSYAYVNEEESESIYIEFIDGVEVKGY